MNYQLINEYKQYTPILTQVLLNRGITDRNYLNLSESALYSPYRLNDIEKAADLIIKHCKNNDNILIVVDSDCDGYTSSAALYNYLILAFPNIEKHLDFILHSTKAHKIIVNDEILQKYKLICVPDAGSNDTTEQKILLDNNIDLVILDHHEVESEINTNDNFALVNNQNSKDYPNKMISGVGVVWKALTVLDKKLNLQYANLFLDLVAIGMAADMQSIQNSETAFLIREGLKAENIRNPFFSAYIKNSSFTIKDIDEINYITVSFLIAPAVNAVTRVGTIEEKILLFSSMLFNCAYRLVPSTKKGHKENDCEILVEQAFRISNNVKNRQKQLKLKGTDYIKSIMKDYDLDKEKSIILNINNHLDKNLVGLVANEITAEYQRPVLLLSEVDDELVGSGRNYDRSEINNLKSVLNDIKEVNWAKGHMSAFGVSIQNKGIDEVKKQINLKFKDVNLTPKYDIDYIITPNDQIDWISTEIKDIGSSKYLWGKGCEEPLILLKDFTISTNNVQLLGKSGKNVLKIVINPKLTAIKFNATEQEYQEIINGIDTKNISIIGQCSVNHWMGQDFAQIKIVDYEIKNNSHKWIF